MINLLLDKIFGRRCVICGKRIKRSSRCMDEWVCENCRNWYIRLFYWYVMLRGIQ